MPWNRDEKLMLLAYILRGEETGKITILAGDLPISPMSYIMQTGFTLIETKPEDVRRE